MRLRVYRPRDPAATSKAAEALVKHNAEQAAAGAPVRIPSHRDLRRIIDESGARFVGYVSPNDGETLRNFAGEPIGTLERGDILVQP